MDATRPPPNAFTGYLLMLYGEDGSKKGRDCDTYEEALNERTVAMRTGLYFKAWIFSKPIIVQQRLTKGGGGRSGDYDL